MPFKLTHFNWQRWFPLALLGTFLAFNLYAETTPQAGQLSASFLKINPGVRQAALGGDHVAATGDIESLFSNPAGLTGLERPEIWATYIDSFINSSQQSLAFGFPTGRWAWGWATQYSNDGKIKRTQNYLDSFNTSDSFRPYSAVTQLTTGVRVGKSLSLGLTGKGFYEKLDKTSNKGWAADAGLLVKSLLPRVDVGMAYRNLGPQINGFDLPSSWASGIGWDLPGRWLKPVKIFSEYERPRHLGSIVRNGVEFQWSHFWLRGGHYKVLSDRLDQTGHVSLGGGIRLGHLKLDYAFKEGENLGDQHQFSLNWGFGLTAEERRKGEEKLSQIMTRRMKDQARGHFNRGQEAMKVDKWPEAIQEFSRALMWDPDDLTSQQKLQESQAEEKKIQIRGLLAEGETLFKQQRWIDAAVPLKKALTLDPSNKTILDKFNEAQTQISSLKRNSNGKLGELFNKGTLYYIQGEFGNALGEWTKILQQDPQWPHIQEYVAKAKAGSLGQKVEEQTKIIQSQNKEIETLSQNAYTFYTLGDRSRAIRSWEKILALDPSNQDAQWALNEIKKSGSSSNLVSANLNLTERKVNELNVQAIQEYSRGNLPDAIVLWKESLQLDPQNPRIKKSIERVEQEMAVQLEAR